MSAYASRGKVGIAITPSSITLQILRGTSVGEMSDKVRRLYALHAARGLSAIHERHRIHRDVKSGSFTYNYAVTFYSRK